MNILFPLSWTVLVIILLMMPGSSIPSTPVYHIPNIDKVAHFILFGGLTFWWALFFRKNCMMNGRWKSRVWSLVIYSILLGAVLEFFQLIFINNRDFDLLDIAANSLGAVITGLGLIFFTQRNN